MLLYTINNYTYYKKYIFILFVISIYSMCVIHSIIEYNNISICNYRYIIAIKKITYFI